MKYGQLAVCALNSHGLLCLGLYRLFNEDANATDNEEREKEKDNACEQQQPASGPAGNRYVITHPQFNFQLKSTDKVNIHLRPLQPRWLV